MKCYNCEPRRRAIYRVGSPWWMCGCDVCKPLFENSLIVNGREVSWHRITMLERIKYDIGWWLIWLAYKVNPRGC